eukprot:Tbor_TRINITY_DN2182_c0_g1::TRINITY_DN2182_c0_g1_i1::g.5475::m.5475
MSTPLSRRGSRRPSSITPNRPQSKAIIKLHRDEIKHNNNTQSLIRELEDNSNKLCTTRMKMIEKLLDIAVKDEISKKVNDNNYNIESSGFNDREMKDNIKKCMREEVIRNIPLALSCCTEHPFMLALRDLININNDDAKKEVSTYVDKYITNHINEVLLVKSNVTSNRLESVACGVVTVLNELKQLLRSEKSEIYRPFHNNSNIENTEERIKRVQEGKVILQNIKDIGDLHLLLNTPCVVYNTECGTLEAEIESMKRRIIKLQAEEDNIINIRKKKEEELSLGEAKLTGDIDAACRNHVLLIRELEALEVQILAITQSRSAVPVKKEIEDNNNNYNINNNINNTGLNA